MRFNSKNPSKRGLFDQKMGFYSRKSPKTELLKRGEVIFKSGAVLERIRYFKAQTTCRVGRSVLAMAWVGRFWQRNRGRPTYLLPLNHTWFLLFGSCFMQNFEFCSRLSSEIQLWYIHNGMEFKIPLPLGKTKIF